MEREGLGIVGSSGTIGVKHAEEIIVSDSAYLVGIHDLNLEVGEKQASELNTKFHPTLSSLLDVYLGPIGV